MSRLHEVDHQTAIIGLRDAEVEMLSPVAAAARRNLTDICVNGKTVLHVGRGKKDRTTKYVSAEGVDGSEILVYAEVQDHERGGKTIGAKVILFDIKNPVKARTTIAIVNEDYPVGQKLLSDDEGNFIEIDVKE